MGSPKQFRHGREFAAFLGLVPKQHSIGGKPRLGRISKRGDCHTRTLLTQGAMAALRCRSQQRPGPGQTPRCRAELSRHSHQPQRAAIHDQQGPDLDPLGCRRAGLRPSGLLQRLVVALRRFGFNIISVVPAEPGGRDRIKTDGSHASGSHPSGADCDGGRSTQSADVHSSEPPSC